MALDPLESACSTQELSWFRILAYLARLDSGSAVFESRSISNLDGWNFNGMFFQ